MVPRPAGAVLPSPPDSLPGSSPDFAWYERVLGWTVAAGSPALLLTGLRFDVLELPAEAGAEVLRGPVVTGPVALTGRRMCFLVAPGGAEELDGLLDWLEWGGVGLDLVALGAGGGITAPVPPRCSRGPGAALWLRPPEPGCEARLPALPGPGRGPGSGAGPGENGVGPDLVRLVAAAATECHRARLGRRTRRS
ncbi:SCO3374 family protein [Streptomyces sp. RerS4]|uniref:SCO3374 family protein n=1 Tax=Streptomyces sp. RerS4 TaxID=2942449 RepID=UPI00201BEFB2|nr:SCO3374 family protein [Streptomyces sp. RerS4]UQX01673.1 VOC family protein [Streptomyces sp. RerS4]